MLKKFAQHNMADKDIDSDGEDQFLFETTDLRLFDNVEDRFIYAIDVDEKTLNLVVSRNSIEPPWFGKHNPELF